MNSDLTESKREKMANQSLPTKESAAFKRLVKCYEEKQFKNGLRFAKQILGNPKTAEHGETLAYKSLLLLGLGKKEEALECVKKGLKNNLKSYVCWHSYGLINRAERKYGEAIKCFRNALRFDPENFTVLRDLSVLQIHTRDLEGFRESRHQMFQIKPAQRATWSGLALSYHLSGDLEMASHILEEFCRSQKSVNRDLVEKLMKKMFNKNTDYDYEHSELLLYQNLVLRDSGKTDEALKHLEEHEEAIFDKIKVLELKGKLNLDLHNYKKAKDVYQDLIKHNQENSYYFLQLIASKQLTIPEDICMLLSEYIEKYPKSRVLPILMLKNSSNSDFEEKLKGWLMTAVRKGVCSALQELEFVYEDEAKVGILENLLIDLIENLKSQGSFDVITSDFETPTCYLWANFLAANHFDKRKKYDIALEKIDLTIEHTPTVVELYTLKAKILKHKEDLKQAVECLQEAQSMDTSDRFLGCKLAKYMLRAGMIDKAVEMMGNFTKPGEDPLDYLDETQCTWFSIEMAKAFRKKGKVGEALKKCFEIKRYFEEVREDQLDFHLFAMTKLRLCAYVDLLNLEDNLKKFGFYKEAATVAIQIYLDMHDGKTFVGSNENLLNEISEVEESDNKKMKNKAKKAKMKEEAMKTKLKGKPGKVTKNTTNVEHKEKQNLNHEELEATKSPLEEATVFLKPLQELLGQQIETQFLAFEINYRKGKPLLMLQALRKASFLNKKHPQMESLVKRFNDYISMNTLSDPVKVW